jgi:hypothetical protein
MKDPNEALRHLKDRRDLGSIALAEPMSAAR